MNETKKEESSNQTTKEDKETAKKDSYEVKDGQRENKNSSDGDLKIKINVNPES